jgi:hypothetical protein
MSSKPKSLKKRLSMKLGKKDKAEKAAAEAPQDPTPAAAAASAMPGPGTPEEKVKGWFKANPGESPAPPAENKKKLVFNDDAAMSLGPDDSVSQVARGEVKGIGKLLAFAGAVGIVAMASAALKSLIKPKPPPAPKYKEYCLAPKFGDKMKVPGVCLRVPEKITVDFKDKSKMDLPRFKLVKPAGTA